MKDSQDWLDALLADRLWFAEQELNAGQNVRDTLTNMKDELDSAIRKHILQEALSLIGEDEPENFVQDYYDEGYEANQLRQELRNKFNDKYKED